MAENRRDLLDPAFAFASQQVERIATAQQRFLEQQGTLLEQRATEGKIVEGHGDLRPEHIWMSDPPRIIDCLEFNRDLRLLDPVSELAFLVLEYERLQAGWIGDMALATYARSSGGAPDAPVVEFYRSWHACMRARIALWHLHDEKVGQSEKWRTRGSLNESGRIRLRGQNREPPGIDRSGDYSDGFRR